MREAGGRVAGLALVLQRGVHGERALSRQSRVSGVLNTGRLAAENCTCEHEVSLLSNRDRDSYPGERMYPLCVASSEQLVSMFL